MVLMYKIEVENSLCEGPFTCGKCFRVCPTLVFFTYPKSREPHRVKDDWVVTGIFADRCVGCGECVNVCPKGAIKMKETD